MITLFLIFGGLYMIGKVIPFLCKLLFVGIFLFFEITGFLLLCTMIGVIGIILFLIIDFAVLRLIIRIFII